MFCKTNHAASWRSKNSGFTLIEVMTVVAVIGILIAIVWMAVYADPPKEILDVTLSESAANRHHGKAFTWGGLWKTRTLWGVLLIRFVSDPVWYFCLFLQT